MKIKISFEDKILKLLEDEYKRQLSNKIRQRIREAKS